MTTKRVMLILAVALVLQLTLAAALWWPHQAASGGEALLAGVTEAQVTELTISDSTGQTVHLVRTGETWVLPEADDFPADGERVQAALTKLLAVTRGIPVTETAGSHERLQLGEDNFARRIQVETEDGATLALLLGASSGSGDSYVRLPDEDAVYQGRALAAWEWSNAPSGWVDTLYVDIPHDTVSSLTLTNAQGELGLARRDDGGWELEGAPADHVLDDTAVNALVQRAATVRMSAPLSRSPRVEYGLDAPLATVVLTTDEGPQTLLVGAALADGNYAVKSSAAAYVVSVAPYSVQSLLEASVDTLRKQPQATTP